MKRIKLIILPVIICAFITGCNNAQINDEDKQTNNKSAQTSETNDDKENKDETSDASQTNEKNETGNESLQASDKDNEKSTETNSQNDNSVNDEIFFGDWTITGTAASGPVTIYSTEDIEKIIGTKIYYGKDKFISDDKVVNNPIYETKSVSRDDFSSDHANISFDTLGITSDSINDTTVSASDNSIVDNIGNSFLIIDNNNLIIYNGGVFFKASRA